MISETLSSSAFISKSFRTFFIEDMKLFLTLPNRINCLQMGKFRCWPKQRLRMNFRKKLLTQE